MSNGPYLVEVITDPNKKYMAKNFKKISNKLSYVLKLYYEGYKYHLGRRLVWIY